MIKNIKKIIKDSNKPIQLIIGRDDILGIPIEWDNLNNLNITEYKTGKVEIDNTIIRIILSSSIPKDKIYIINGSNIPKYILPNFNNSII